MLVGLDFFILSSISLISFRPMTLVLLFQAYVVGRMQKVTVMPSEQIWQVSIVLMKKTI